MACYAYLRFDNPIWPKPFDLSPTILTAFLMSAILLSSSITMILAVRAMKQNNRNRAACWLSATSLCGLAFVVAHALEWRRLWFVVMLTAASNPWGQPLFGATFYGLTGFHLLHVVCGVIYLGVVAIAVARGKFAEIDVEVSSLYWHFVGLIWAFLFPLVYLTALKS